MIDIYIAFDRFQYGEDFTVYYISDSREDALQHCFGEDFPNSIRLNYDKDFYTFRLQKVCITKKEYNAIQKQVAGQVCDRLYKMKFLTMLESFYNGEEYETEVLLSVNIREEYFKAIDFYTGDAPCLSDISSWQEYCTADSVYTEKISEIMQNQQLFAEVLKEYIKEKYQNE